MGAGTTHDDACRFGGTDKSNSYGKGWSAREDVWMVCVKYSRNTVAIKEVMVAGGSRIVIGEEVSLVSFASMNIGIVTSYGERR
jgi:hypothetical protein